jgi:hypothetical protein
MGLTTVVYCTGWAISPCTATIGSGGGPEAAGPEQPDHSDACRRYWGRLPKNLKAVALSVGMQQALLQIMQNQPCALELPGPPFLVAQAALFQV